MRREMVVRQKTRERTVRTGRVRRKDRGAHSPPTGSLGLPVTNWTNCLCSAVS